jgi:DnaK suppressor protein
MTLDTTHFKAKLEEELALLERELGEIGRKKPSNPADWEAKPAELDILEADKNEVADRIEEFDEHNAVLVPLEIQYNEVKAALARIKDGAYGICEKDGKEISTERLEAFPAARTCVEHVEKQP